MAELSSLMVGGATITYPHLTKTKTTKVKGEELRLRHDQ